MKKPIRITTAILIAIMCIALLPSCSKAPPLEGEGGIKDELVALIENSFEINELFFGDGFETMSEEEASAYESVDGYEYVSYNAEYHSVEEMKIAAEKVYSEEYLKAIYQTLFTGYADPTAGILPARFIEEKGMLMQEKGIEALYEGTRKFDYSTMKIARPSRRDLVNIQIETWIEGATLRETSEDYNDQLNAIISGKRYKFRLTFVNTADGWRLDSPTY